MANLKRRFNSLEEDIIESSNSLTIYSGKNNAYEQSQPYQELKNFYELCSSNFISNLEAILCPSSTSKCFDPNINHKTSFSRTSAFTSCEKKSLQNFFQEQFLSILEKCTLFSNSNLTNFCNVLHSSSSSSLTNRPSKRIKIDEADSPIPLIFLQIPPPLWKIIFLFLEKEDKSYFANLRLTCRRFRDLITESQLWRQNVPIYELQGYVQSCQKFEYSPQFLCINSKVKENIFQPMCYLTSLKELRFEYSLKDEHIPFLPTFLEKLDISGCKEITNNGLSKIHSNLKELNIHKCEGIKIDGLVNLPPDIRIQFFEDITDMTPLIACAYESNIELVKKILEKGVSINQGNSKGETAFYYACYNGDIEMIRFLLDNGAHLDDKCTNDGWTPLAIACYYDHPVAVEFLLSKGADVNKGILDDGTTPLYIACQEGHKVISKLLIQRNADVKKGCIDDGTTPLYSACREGHLEMVELLLAQGLEVNDSLSNNGSTPLIAASHHGHKDIVQYLIQRGANVNKPSYNDEFTPLYMACQDGKVDVVEVLLEKGADPNLSISDGFTPLIIASQYNHKKVVELLLQYNANVDKPHPSGGTALYMASQKGHIEIMKLLLEKNAYVDSICEGDPNILVRNNMDEVQMNRTYPSTPLYIAWWQEREEAIQLLKQTSNIQLNIELATKNQHPKALQFFESLLQT